MKLERKPSQDELAEFVEKVREVLTRRLEAVSLRLLDLGMKFTDKADIYIIVGWAERRITKQQTRFETKPFYSDIRKDGKGVLVDVEDMAKAIVDSLVKRYYESVHKVTTLRGI